MADPGQSPLPPSRTASRLAKRLTALAHHYDCVGTAHMHAAHILAADTARDLLATSESADTIVTSAGHLNDMVTEMDQLMAGTRRAAHLKRATAALQRACLAADRALIHARDQPPPLFAAPGQPQPDH